MPDAPPLPRFSRDFKAGGSALSRIGSGAIGGKASGLVQIQNDMISRLESDTVSGIEVTVPAAVILTTEVFERFVERNDLMALVSRDVSDDRIARAFQQASFPAEYVGDLRSLIANVRTPLAVRSSSLLEDALDHPFAGVYGTKMIPNNRFEEEARFAQLVEAIKFVFATTYFAASQDYLHSIGGSLGDEKMAVIIQEVIGRRIGDRFYPLVSAVGRSHNFYPTGVARPSDGVVTLALGLGKTIVDGGFSWSYSPAYPKAPPPFNDVGDLLKYTQTSFWAVHMGDPPPYDPIRETEHLVRAGLAEAEADGALKYLVSTYDQGSDRLNPGLDRRGPRALTFAPLVGSRLMPFNDIFRRLLEVAGQALGGPVEIELAVDLDPANALPARVGFLQVRPMMIGGGGIEVSDDEMLGDSVLVASDTVLGHGQRDDITDIVFVNPQSFEPAATQSIARELESVNRELVASRRHSLLMGIGRWGTSDASLGIPVVWGQISSARVIVEATLPDVQPDLSQGSHFFHNVLSFRVLYFSVEHFSPHRIDWDWLATRPVVRTTPHVTHVRLTVPLDVRVDGSTGRGVILHHD